MAISKAQKIEISAKLDSALKSETAVFVSFEKLGVEDSNVLRKSLKSNDSDYLVAKKTLINRAIDSASAKGDKPNLGEKMVAVAFGNDQMAPAREIFNFGKEYAGTVSILGGIFDGQFKSQQEMMEIATIPALDELRGMFANVINSPIARFAIVLDQVAQKQA